MPARPTNTVASRKCILPFNINDPCAGCMLETEMVRSAQYFKYWNGDSLISFCWWWFECLFVQQQSLCPAAKGPQVSTSPSCISAPSQPHISVGPPTVFHSDLLFVFYAPSQIYHLHFIGIHQLSMFSGVWTEELGNKYKLFALVKRDKPSQGPFTNCFRGSIFETKNGRVVEQWTYFTIDNEQVSGL